MRIWKVPSRNTSSWGSNSFRQVTTEICSFGSRPYLFLYYLHQTIKNNNNNNKKKTTTDKKEKRCPLSHSQVIYVHSSINESIYSVYFKAIKWNVQVCIPQSHDSAQRYPQMKYFWLLSESVCVSTPSLCIYLLSLLICFHFFLLKSHKKDDVVHRSALLFSYLCTHKSTSFFLYLHKNHHMRTPCFIWPLIGGFLSSFLVIK